MPALTVATFNVENLLTRFAFDRDREGALDETASALFTFADEASELATLQAYKTTLSDDMRQLTAQAIRDTHADLLILQEVEGQPALEAFYANYLNRAGDAAARHVSTASPNAIYPHRVAIDGNDGRGIGIAAISKWPFKTVTSHRHVTFRDLGLDPAQATTGGNPPSPDDRIFKRDCLELDLEVEGHPLTVFGVHFKSMDPQRDHTRPVRMTEATAVRALISRKFPDPAAADWLLMGDLNDYHDGPDGDDPNHGLAPLLDWDACEDLFARVPDFANRWTHYWVGGDQHRQLDYILASRALGARNAATLPRAIRRGMPYRAGLPYRADPYACERYPRVGWDRPKASDHCPVVVRLEI